MNPRPDVPREPLGATLEEDGATFAVASQNAESVCVCLFDEAGRREVSRVPLTRRADGRFAGFVPGVVPGTRYGLRADGPYDPRAGHRFDPLKLLVDPYATAIDRPFAFRPELAAPRAAAVDTAPWVPKAIVATPAANPPARRPGKAPPRLVYEICVRAFSKRHPGIAEPLRGTLAALGEPAAIDHLLTLGVDTVELLPIAAAIDEAHLVQRELRNIWRYNPVIFMAPDPWLVPGGLAEMRATAARLRAAGIAVVFDVVFNHTGESDAFGPTLSLRGLDNALYYRHDAAGNFVDHSGCGNTLACDRPAVIRLILDALHHWAVAGGVDGFRFDLAPILGRDAAGFRSDAPLLAAIRSDPRLSSMILIAEPWDIGPGGHRLGAFGAPFHEWNDAFRDDLRRFWRGEPQTLGRLATRLAGSSDIFAHRRPSASLNFITAHDGFTLRDLVSYGHKHNEANGEGNRDGTDANQSWNNGVEGKTSDADIVANRLGDIRALLASLFASRGIPMLTAGDEFGRTQDGNNNAYAQDNATAWLDWVGLDKDLLAFAGRLAAFRRDHACLTRDRFLSGAAEGDAPPDVAWLRADGGTMTLADWEAPDARVLGMALFDAPSADRVLVWVNGSATPVTARAPAPGAGQRWRIGLASADAAALRGIDCTLPPRSVTFLEAEAGRLSEART